MNAFSEPALDDAVSVSMLTPARVRAARLQAAREQRSVPAVLDDELALGPDRLVRALGLLLQHPVLDSAALAALDPAFDLIGYADAARRGCLAFRSCRGPAEPTDGGDQRSVRRRPAGLVHRAAGLPA